jgi:hypothetical protein
VWGRRGINSDFVGKAEGKRPLGRPRRMWKSRIKMDLKRNTMPWNGLNSSGSVLDRWRALVKRVTNLQAP